MIINALVINKRKAFDSIHYQYNQSWSIIIDEPWLTI